MSQNSKMDYNYDGYNQYGQQNSGYGDPNQGQYGQNPNQYGQQPNYGGKWTTQLQSFCNLATLFLDY